MARARDAPTPGASKDEVRLPAPIRLAWGGREPTRAALTTERVVSVGVELADSNGIESVTIRKLSARLGYTTMAVYRHISSREELLLLMLDRALGAPPALSGRLSWPNALRRWANGLYGSYSAHPWLLDLPLPGLPTTPNHAMWVERALAATMSLALNIEQRLEAALLIDGHARSIANVTRSARIVTQRAGTHPAQALYEVADERRYPHFREVLRLGSLQDETPPDLSFGLEVIIAGLSRRSAP